MRLASDAVLNGMAGGDVFKQALIDTIVKYQPDTVIETGTYLGIGTSAAILEGLNQVGEEFAFYSIEVNPDYYKVATRNISDPNAILLHGLSIPREMIPDKINYKGLPDHIYVDHPEAIRNQEYTKEVSFKALDNMLGVAMSLCNSFSPAMVVLDSAGHLGKIEFDYLMRLHRGETFILALDDTEHFKHHATTEAIKQDKRFTLLWSSKAKFGSAIYKFTE